MKILDRYITISIAGAFLFGVAMFMALFLAGDLMQKLIEMISEQGIAPGTALTIFAYRIPRFLVLTFPMSVLLSILLTFNRMSADSEMVAIRAGGTSFMRIVAPAMAFAIVIAAFTLYLSDSVVPSAGRKAMRLTEIALNQRQLTQPIKLQHIENDKKTYSFEAAGFDYEDQRLDDLTMIFFGENNIPQVVVYAKQARWDTKTGHWRFHHASIQYVNFKGPALVITDSDLTLQSFALQLKENPFDIATSKKRPEELTAGEIRGYIAHLQQIKWDDREVNRWAMGLAHRYSVPFTCLIFALIAAPLGLRSHRTSSSVGLGVSLLIIFVYYLLFHQLTTLGESGALHPLVAAWLPNIIGGIAGIVLIIRANR